MTEHVQIVQSLRSVPAVQIVSEVPTVSKCKIRYGLNGAKRLNGWNGLNDWNKFISAISAAQEPPCRNFCTCAVFRRWKTSDRPAPRDRRGNRRLRPKSHKPSRHNCCRTI